MSDIRKSDAGLNAFVDGISLSTGNNVQGKGRIVDVTQDHHGDVVHVEIGGKTEHFRQQNCSGTGM